jgi:hypothetical protein
MWFVIYLDHNRMTPVPLEVLMMTASQRTFNK